MECEAHDVVGVCKDTLNKGKVHGHAEGDPPVCTAVVSFKTISQLFRTLRVHFVDMPSLSKQISVIDPAVLLKAQTPIGPAMHSAC